jgi:hypothetical protein
MLHEPQILDSADRRVESFFMKHCSALCSSRFLKERTDHSSGCVVEGWAETFEIPYSVLILASNSFG